MLATMTRARGFCFTLNNPDQHNFGDPDKLLHRAKKYGCSFIKFALEIGEEGTPHYQGFLYYNNQRVMTRVAKKLFKGKAHLEIMRGNDFQNEQYISKDPIEGPYEWGTKPSQGTRSDWTEVHNSIKKGASWLEIADTNAQLAYTCKRSIDESIAIHTKATTGERNVIWLWGDTGTGKTRTAYDAGATSMEWSNATWRDYTAGTKTVVWDEFDKWTNVPWANILKLLDRYPVNVQMRYNNQAWTAETIYITSTDQPQNVVPTHLWTQVQRRLKTISHLT